MRCEIAASHLPDVLPVRRDPSDPGARQPQTLVIGCLMGLAGELGLAAVEETWLDLQQLKPLVHDGRRCWPDELLSLSL